MSQDNFITVTIRSHVPPSAGVENFEIGKPYQVKVKCNTTITEFLQQLFPKNRNNVGFVAVNGRLVREQDRTLSKGDSVFFYSLAGGG